MANEKDDQGAAAPHSLTLVIDRAKWLRGEGEEQSSLLRPTDGKMCCLGFYGLACGVTREQIMDKNTPWASRRDAGAHWPEWMFCDTGHVDSVVALFNTNDHENLSEEERERDIARLFAKHGIAVEFVGDAAPAAPKEP